MADLWTGDLPIRKAANYAMWLPQGAAVYRSEGSDLAWTTGDHLLSLVTHLLNVGNWQRGGGKGSKPEPLPTPEKQAKELNRVERLMEQARAMQERNAARARAGE